MDKQGHLERVTELQARLNAQGRVADTDYARAQGSLREAIAQAGMAHASIEEIKEARTKAR